MRTILTAPFPKEIKGIIFTEVVPKLTPEIDPTALIRLGTIVRKKNKITLYKPLTDALRKIQWVKLMAIEAIATDTEISGQMDSDNLVSYPYGQMRHALSVTGALFHTKSAVDSIAIFLTDLLRLKAQGGQRDFKKPEFRKEVDSNDPILWGRLKGLESWFNDLQLIRDEWIHRSSIRCMLINGPSEVGALPIPKKNIELGLDAFKEPMTSKHFYSTKQFLDNHYNNLVQLFCKVIERCIEIELVGFTEPPIDSEVEARLYTFPTMSTQSRVIQKFRVKIGPLGF